MTPVRTIPMERTRSEEGFTFVTLVIVLVALIAFGALALDYSRFFMYKQSVQDIGQMMAEAAEHGYHFSPLIDEYWDAHEVTTQDEENEHLVRLTAGMASAQRVFDDQSYNLIKDDVIERADIFGPSVDWINSMDVLIASSDGVEPLSAVSSIYADYDSGNVKFGYLSGETFNTMSASEMSSKANDAGDGNIGGEIEAAKVDIQSKSIGGVIGKIFNASPSSVVVDAKTGVRLKNEGITHCVVVVIDRSVSMGSRTDPGTYNWYHGMQQGGAAIQPMQDILDTVRDVIPGRVDDGNWFREDTGKNNSLGIVLFDVVGEALRFDSGLGDIDEHLSHNEDNDGYLEVYNALNVTLSPQEAPRLPIITLAGGDFDPLLGGDCISAHSTDDTCRHDKFRYLDQVKEHWSQYYFVPPVILLPPNADGRDLWALRDPVTGLPEDGVALDSFFPAMQSDGSLGLELAIEMIRKERARFALAYPTEYAAGMFKGEIVLITDGGFNIFHDRNLPIEGADPLPAITEYIDPDTFTRACDEKAMTKSGRGYDDIVYPAAWRKRMSHPKNYASDIYHDGTSEYDCSMANCLNGTGDLAPLGVESSDSTGVTNTHNISNIRLWHRSPCATAGNPNCCPGPQCRGLTSSCVADAQDCNAHPLREEITFASHPGAIGAPPADALTCAKLAAMDYARWALSNEITVHTVGVNMSDDYEDELAYRTWVLGYIADPDGDETTFPAVTEPYADTDCSGSDCVTLSEALKEIGDTWKMEMSSL